MLTFFNIIKFVNVNSKDTVEFTSDGSVNIGMNDKKITLGVNVNNIASLITNGWQYEVASNAENNFSTPFDLASTSTILYNGYPLRSSQWSGAGTSTLTVSVSTKQYDFITIIK